MDYYIYVIKEIERTGGEYRYPVVVGSISGIMRRSDLSNNEKLDAIQQVLKAFEETNIDA